MDLVCRWCRKPSSMQESAFLGLGLLEGRSWHQRNWKARTEWRKVYCAVAVWQIRFPAESRHKHDEKMLRTCRWSP